MALLEKLAMIKLRFDDVAQQIIEPEVIADMKRYVKLNKEYKDLMPIVDAYKTYKTVCDNIDESNEILESEDDPEMKEMARKCRIEICKMTHRAQAGHPGGSLSEIDILCALYGHRLRVKPQDPDWDDRDRFILSKGHASPGMYAVTSKPLESLTLATFLSAEFGFFGVVV